MNYRKLTTGNYLGRQGKFYAFIFRRPHGKWCAAITCNKEPVGIEGYHGTYLSTLSKAKNWVKITVEKYTV